MPSRRHKTAMLSSPRSPDTTIRIFSSAVYCLRVLRRISRTVLSAGSFLLIDFCLIFVPFGHYDEPEILRYAITSIYPKGADVRQTPRPSPSSRWRAAKRKPLQSAPMKSAGVSIRHSGHMSWQQRPLVRRVSIFTPGARMRFIGISRPIHSISSNEKVASSAMRAWPSGAGFRRCCVTRC